MEKWRGVEENSVRMTMKLKERERGEKGEVRAVSSAADRTLVRKMKATRVPLAAQDVIRTTKNVGEERRFSAFLRGRRKGADSAKDQCCTYTHSLCLIEFLSLN